MYTSENEEPSSPCVFHRSPQACRVRTWASTVRKDAPLAACREPSFQAKQTWPLVESRTHYFQMKQQSTARYLIPVRIYNNLYRTGGRANGATGGARKNSGRTGSGGSGGGGKSQGGGRARTKFQPFFTLTSGTCAASLSHVSTVVSLQYK